MKYNFRFFGMMMLVIPSVAFANVGFEMIKGRIVNVLALVDKELDQYFSSVEASDFAVSDSAFNTFASEYLTSVTHTASDRAGSTGTIVYVFNSKLPSVSASQIQISYIIEDTILVVPPSCEYIQGGSATVDLTAVELYPKSSGSGTGVPTNAFGWLEGVYIKGCTKVQAFS